MRHSRQARPYRRRWLGRYLRDRIPKPRSAILKGTSVADWRRALHEDMEFWSDDETAGSEDKYQPIADELWLSFHLN